LSDAEHGYIVAKIMSECQKKQMHSTLLHLHLLPSLLVFATLFVPLEICLEPDSNIHVRALFLRESEHPHLFHLRLF
jgi:hypothetical protein